MERQMLKLASFVFVLIATSATGNLARSQDLYCLAFEDSSMVVEGRKYECDLYYILLGDNGQLQQGDLLQFVRQHSQPNTFSMSRARFQFSLEWWKLTINWQASSREKYGSVEQGILAQRAVDSPTELTYTIERHTGDVTQVGLVYRVKAVDYASLPKWVQNAASPIITAKLPLDVQLELHRQQAAILRIIGQAAEEYLK